MSYVPTNQAKKGGSGMGSMLLLGGGLLALLGIGYVAMKHKSGSPALPSMLPKSGFASTGAGVKSPGCGCNH